MGEKAASSFFMPAMQTSIPDRDLGVLFRPCAYSLMALVASSFFMPAMQTPFLIGIIAMRFARRFRGSGTQFHQTSLYDEVSGNGLILMSLDVV
jgi:hypothetical protein